MRQFAILAIFVPLSAFGQSPFASVSLKDDGTRLEIRDHSGSSRIAPKLNEQMGFQSPKIALGGRYAGWLAISAYCCTSYPIPLALVIVDTEGRLHEFKGQQATFGWCFGPEGTTVAYKRETLHGASPEFYELRRIEDEALLQSFEVPLEVSSGEAPRPKLPGWATCAEKDAAGAQPLVQLDPVNRER